MSQSSKPTARAGAAFWLNPNVVANMTSGFKAYISKPIQIAEPEPEFALTVPGELAALPDVADPKEWH